jgi:hypothetical protein
VHLPFYSSYPRGELSPAGEEPNMTRQKLILRISLMAAAVILAGLALGLLQLGLARAAGSSPATIILPTGNTSRTGAPGGRVTFTVGINNNSAITDIFTLTISGHGWPTVLVLVPGTVVIPETQILGTWTPNQTRTVEIGVTIPITAGGSDTVTFEVRSKDNPSVFASALLVTTVQRKFYLPTLHR